jgi:hypothetical protein
MSSQADPCLASKVLQLAIHMNFCVVLLVADRPLVFCHEPHAFKAAHAQCTVHYQWHP